MAKDVIRRNPPPFDPPALPPGYLARIPAAVREGMNAVIAGATNKEAAKIAGCTEDVFQAHLLHPPIREALAQLRSLYREQVRDKAFYNLACLAGAVKDKRFPEAESEMVRGTALKFVLGGMPRGTHPSMTPTLAIDEPLKMRPAPSLIITLSEPAHEEPKDITDAA